MSDDKNPSPQAQTVGWLELSDDAKDAGRILLLWKPFGGVKEHIELGRWDKVKLVWVNTYGHKFSNDPDQWSPLAPYNPWGHVPCPCTTFEQDEDCPQGAPSLLCAACSGTGNATQDTVVALAAEMLKVAEQVDELEDPFAAWESIDLIKADLAKKVGSQALLDVAAERKRQVEVEGWTPEHDDKHSDGQLAAAAHCYVAMASINAHLGLTSSDRNPPFEGWVGFGWPWEKQWWKPGTNRQMLIKAGALIIAEIERLDRAAPASEGSDNG